MDEEPPNVGVEQVPAMQGERADRFLDDGDGLLSLDFVEACGRVNPHVSTDRLERECLPGQRDRDAGTDGEALQRMRRDFAARTCNQAIDAHRKLVHEEAKRLIREPPIPIGRIEYDCIPALKSQHEVRAEERKRLHRGTEPSHRRRGTTCGVAPEK